MSIKQRLQDGEGSGVEAGVTPRHALKVEVLPSSSKSIPPSELTALKQLREFFANGGCSTAMDVNGATTPVDFKIAADAGKTKWIDHVRIVLTGTNMEIDTNDFRRFGAATAINTPLTNGVLFFTQQGGIETQIFAEPVKYLGDFFFYADEHLAIKNSVSASDDFVSFDFNFPTPIVLPEGSEDALVIRVRDNLTALLSFQAVARGYQELT